MGGKRVIATGDARMKISIHIKTVSQRSKMLRIIWSRTNTNTLNFSYDECLKTVAMIPL